MHSLNSGFAHEHNLPVTQVQTYPSGATHSGTTLLHTPLALPVDLRFPKHITGNVHAVAVIPDVAGITLGHLITFLFRHATRTVELHCLWLSLDTLSLAQHRKTRNLAILKTSYQMWPDLTVIKPNTARVQATAYVKCIGYDQNPAVRTIGTTLGANDNYYQTLRSC